MAGRPVGGDLAGARGQQPDLADYTSESGETAAPADRILRRCAPRRGANGRLSELRGTRVRPPPLRSGIDMAINTVVTKHPVAAVFNVGQGRAQIALPHDALDSAESAEHNSRPCRQNNSLFRCQDQSDGCTAWAASRRMGRDDGSLRLGLGGRLALALRRQIALMVSQSFLPGREQHAEEDHRG